MRAVSDTRRWRAKAQIYGVQARGAVVFHADGHAFPRRAAGRRLSVASGLATFPLAATHVVFMNRRLSAFAVGCLACLATIAPRVLTSQRPAANPDSLLRRGLVARAESLYYAAARNRPRDPAARWSLGNFLIARGATRIGMTLVEEAMQFGFDKDRASRALAPVYLDVGEYRKLSTLPGAALGAGERARARFLDTHPTRTIAPDSIVSAAYAPEYAPASNGSSYGAITIRVNGKALNATIVNSGPELVLAENSLVAKQAHRFASESVRGRIETPGVVDSIGVSRLVIANVPVTIAPMPRGSEAAVSLAFLARYAPTFDARTRLIVLRTSGNSSPPPNAGSAFETLQTNGEFSVLKAGGWVALDDTSIVHLIRNRRWTLDAKHGSIAVAP